MTGEKQILSAAKQEEIVLENGALVAYEDAFVVHFQHRQLDTHLLHKLALVGCYVVPSCCPCCCAGDLKGRAADLSIGATLGESTQSFVLPRGTVCSVTHQAYMDETAQSNVHASRPGQRSCCLDTCCCCCFPTPTQLRLSHETKPVKPNNVVQDCLLGFCKCTLSKQPLATWVNFEPTLRYSTSFQRDVTFGMQGVTLPGKGESDAVFQLTVSRAVPTDVVTDFVGLLQDEALAFQATDRVEDDPDKKKKVPASVSVPLRLPTIVPDEEGLLEQLVNFFVSFLFETA